MQVQMTERDKKLIVFLAIFVIVVAIGYWGIYPMVKGIINTKQDIQHEEEIREKNDMKIMQLPILEVQNERMEESILDARSTYFEMMTSDQVDRYMTNLCLDYSLYAYDLNITMPEEAATLEPYQYSEKAMYADSEFEVWEEETNEVDDFIAEAEGTEEEDTFVYDTSAVNGIHVAYVKMRVGGDDVKLQKFIDDLSNTNLKAHLTNYTWSDERKVEYGEDGEYDILTSRTLTVTIAIYMCEE